MSFKNWVELQDLLFHHSAYSNQLIFFILGGVYMVHFSKVILAPPQNLFAKKHITSKFYSNKFTKVCDSRVGKFFITSKINTDSLLLDFRKKWVGCSRCVNSFSVFTLSKYFSLERTRINFIWTAVGLFHGPISNLKFYFWRSVLNKLTQRSFPLRHSFFNIKLEVL